MHDPRLAAVSRSDGTIDPSIVESLLSRPPRTLTIPQLEAMLVIFDEVQYREDNPLAGLTYELEWRDAFIEVIGGTITREKVRHGEVVHHSVRRYRGRADVRRHRGEIPSNTGPRPRATARESHRSRPGHRRSASSSATASADPPESEPEPAEPAVIRVRRPSGRLDTFLADSIERGDGILWATGRWRGGRAGVYGFTAQQIVEVRA